MVRRHHPDRRRSRRSCLGAGLPARRSDTGAQAHRLDPRLVCGLPRLRLLHGDPVAAGGDRRRRPRPECRGVRLPGSRGSRVRAGTADRGADPMGCGPALGGGTGNRRSRRGGEALRRRCRSEPCHRRAAATGCLRRMGVASAGGSAPLASPRRGGRSPAGTSRGSHALRRVHQARGDRWSGRSSHGRVGHGPDRGSRTRGPGPGGRGHAAVPVRPLVQHLRRQPDVHHGG